MMKDEVPFEQHLAILATILMAKHGNEVVVTPEEVAQARRILAEHEVQMVAVDESRLFGDRIIIKFRHRSRRVLRGEVVYDAG